MRALSDLAGAYPNLDDKARLAAARGAWVTAATDEAKRQAEAGPPTSLPPVTVEAGGVTYALYGVIHGIVGGESKAYRDFVRDGVAALERPVMENGIRHLYPNDAVEEIPDFAVLGIVGALWMGLLVAIQYPLLLWELARELLRKESPDAAFELESGVLYHGLDHEVRRALGPDGELPSGLSIDLEMRRWDASTVKARLADPSALVPRSLYMAGYAAGSASRRDAERLSLVIGDRHTSEIAVFLTDPEWSRHPLFQRGRRFGALPDGRRRARFAAVKIGHLLLMTLPFTAILIPTLMLFQWWRYQSMPPL